MSNLAPKENSEIDIFTSILNTNGKVTLAVREPNNFTVNSIDTLDAFCLKLQKKKVYSQRFKLYLIILQFIIVYQAYIFILQQHSSGPPRLLSQGD